MEGRHLFGGLTVEDNLILAASSLGRESAGSLEGVYQRWPRLRERSGQLAGTLSGGEQQMLAIGRTLMTRPRLLILDEPSWGLAPRVVRELIQTFLNLREEGMTILLCEQMANLALNICDYAYVMTSGRVALEGNSREITSNPDLHATYLGGSISSHSPEKAADIPATARRVADISAPKPPDTRGSSHDRKQDEAKRREREVRQSVIGPSTSADLSLSPPEPARGEDFSERERRRRMREVSFEDHRTYSDLRKELTGIRKDLEVLAGTAGSVGDIPRSVSGEGGKDRKSMELMRRQRTDREISSSMREPGLHTPRPIQSSSPQTGERRTLEEVRQSGSEEAKIKTGTDSEFRLPRPVVESDRRTRESIRRRRQGDFQREQIPTPFQEEGKDFSAREQDRLRRQKSVMSGGNLDSETPFPSISGTIDRADAERQRREREKTVLGGDMVPAESMQGSRELAERKAGEEARRLRQTAKMRDNKIPPEK